MLRRRHRTCDVSWDALGALAAGRRPEPWASREGDGGCEEGAAVGRAVDAKPSVEGGEPDRKPDKAAPVRPGASDAVVAHLDHERAVLDPRRHLGVSGMS